MLDRLIILSWLWILGWLLACFSLLSSLCVPTAASCRFSCNGRGNASLLTSLPWWWWGWLTPFAIFNHGEEPPASLKWKGGSGHGETFSSPVVGARPLGLTVHILSFHRLRSHGLYLCLYHYTWTTDDPRVSPSRMQKCDEDGIISAGCRHLGTLVLTIPLCRQLDWTPYSESVLYSLYF
jgi:hypothetical protein